MERKQLRLKCWNYASNGAYFVTICIYGKKKTLSKIYRRGDPCGRPIIECSILGKIADDTIKTIEYKFNVKIDKYVIMPNHIHMIIVIDNRTTARVVPTNISNIMSAYKSIIANEYRKECDKRGIRMGNLWQRSYYDHIRGKFQPIALCALGEFSHGTYMQLTMFVVLRSHTQPTRLRRCVELHRRQSIKLT